MRHSGSAAWMRDIDALSARGATDREPLGEIALHEETWL